MNNPFRFDRLTQALEGMTPARKLLAAIMLAALLGGGAWMAIRAGAGPSSGRMEPILDQPFAEADLVQIRQHLDEKHVPNELRDGKVLVPADQRLAALSDLFYSDVLSGGGTDSGFDALVKQMSAWDPPSKTDKLFNQFRESTLRNVIGHFKGVRRATVLIDPTSERHIGQSIRPSAMVDIQTDGGVVGSDARRLANAAVNAVTGAVANLSRDQVKVTIDGAAWNAGLEDLAASDRLQRRLASEQAGSAKIRNLLAYIPDVLVSVSVDERPVAATQPSRDDGPSVVVNAVPMIAPASVKGAVAADAHTASAAPADDRDVVRSASVAVPRSYFVRIYHRANRRADPPADPDDGMLQPIVQSQSRQIGALVKNALGLADESSVTVEPYEDSLGATAMTAPGARASAPPPPSAAASGPVVTLTPVTAGGWMPLLGAHARQATWVAAGVMGMLLLSLLFRRARPVIHAVPSAPAGGDDADPAPAEWLIEDEAPVSVADDESDDRAEAHQIFRRVRDIVRDSPDDAARVLRGWIYQEQ